MRNLFFLLSLLFLIPFVGYSQQIQLKRAEDLYEKHDYIDAQRVYKKVIESGYKSSQVYGNLADSYYYQSNYEEAAIWYEQLFQEFPEDPTASQYIRGIQSYKSIKEYTKAEALLSDYIAKFGDSSISKQYDSDPNYLESIGSANPKVVVAEQAINVSGSDHSPAFFGKDKIVYASASVRNTGSTHNWDGSNFLDLFVVDRNVNDGWLTDKRSLKGNVNSELHESAAVFTKDAKTMYFTRNNIDNGRRRRDGNDLIRLRIFKAELQDNDTWKVVEDLPINDDSFSTAYPALNAAEDKLYFSSDRVGGLGMSDIWFVDLNEDGSYGEPVHLGDVVNTEVREAFLFIDSNDVLYFASDGHLGLGGLDIFSTQLDTDGMPGSVVNMGVPFNSAHDDFALIMDTEKEMGYFTSNRKEAGGANDNIYSFYYKCFLDFKLLVKDAGTKILLPGSMVEVFNEHGELVAKETTEDGSYNLELDCKTVYFVQAGKQGYNIKEYSLYTPNKSGELLLDIELEVDGPCDSSDLGCRLALQPIYFDFDKHSIRADAEIELAKILEAMLLYPKLSIHIESHTDSRGADAYNMSLSETRAQATRDWLINKGIEPSRLTAKGYGETILVNDCSNTVPCTKEEHALNRRSMFIIKD